MAQLDVDVAILGTGFGGSLAGAVLCSLGLRVALLDRNRHPRFAIGESSTPTASLILSHLADQYRLDWLKPLAKFGSWQQSHPGLTCGLKRGFSYFHHRSQPANGPDLTPNPSLRFEIAAQNQNALLVAASSNDQHADTHWLRADVDHFFFEQACAAGCVGFENARITSLQQNAPWCIEFLDEHRQQRSLNATFLVDATGAGQALSRHFQWPDQTERLKTHSRALFAHVEGLPRWEQSLNPPQDSTFPFRCDDAALHHVLDEGWMWWLRFSTERTSIGLVLDSHHFPQPDDSLASTTKSPRAEWERILSRYPALRDAISNSRVVGPEQDIVATGRLQRLSSRIAGPDWALLPHTAGFIDPLHSTGIAHTLAGVERLARLLERAPFRGRSAPPVRTSEDEQTAALECYEIVVRQELLLIDELVSGCQAAIAVGSFRKFAAFSMAYFAAATTWERQRLADPDRQPALFLADDTAFRTLVSDMNHRVPTMSDSDFEEFAEERLAPFNQVGLFHPPVPNMYSATAVPELKHPACCETNSAQRPDTGAAGRV